jgi:hypothetical protein
LLGVGGRRLRLLGWGSSFEERDDGRNGRECVSFVGVEFIILRDCNEHELGDEIYSERTKQQLHINEMLLS